jgi:hypothetical protein
VDEHELAWAAGFFDGDGWAALVRYGRRAKRRPMAQINQAGPDGVPAVLTRFRRAVGVGRVAGPKVEVGRRDLYWWVASSRGDVVRAGSLIGPWLSAEKRRQFSSAVGLAFAHKPLPSTPWAAGLFDAEGSTCLNDHRSHAGFKYIEATITQGGAGGSPEELARFISVVTIGQIYGPYEQEGANEPVYRWRLQTLDGVRRVVHLLLPWLSEVKRAQALAAIGTLDAQPTLPRGRAEWGSHKSHCIRGHDYDTARIRPYVGRGSGTLRRPSKQCLVCAREQARARRQAQKAIGGHAAADLGTPRDGSATC